MACRMVAVEYDLSKDDCVKKDMLGPIENEENKQI